MIGIIVGSIGNGYQSANEKMPFISAEDLLKKMKENQGDMSGKP